MAIRTEAITLDIRPCCDARGPVVCGRQGDEGTVVVATVTRDGEPLALDGLTATLKGNVPGYTETTGTVDGSAATFALDSSVFAHRGIHQLYVELSQGADVVASTQSIELRVAPGADASAGDADDFESFVDQMKADYEAGIDQAEAAFDAALDAKQQEAQGLIDELGDALQDMGAPVFVLESADAEPPRTPCLAVVPGEAPGLALVDGGSRAQISPAWQTQRGSVVQAAGCAEGVPVAGMRVYGETRQNLWVNPTGTINGVTATETDDGALALSGTATKAVYFYITTYALKPGTQYCFSGSGFQKGSSAYIQNANETNFIGVNNESKTFTTKSAFGDAVIFGIQIVEGTTVNATVSVMLNEGSEPAPWCPPGLSSVSELGIVAAGRNLLPRKESAVSPSSGLSASVAEDGAISIIGTSTGSAWLVFGTAMLVEGVEYTISCDQGMGTAMAYFQLYNEFGDLVVVGGASYGNSTTFTPSGTGNYTLCFWTQGAGIKVDSTFRVQLELGSTATDYEPPQVTTTEIDLSGHQLRSLPDGTRDVLSVDGSGAVSVEQRTMSVTFDGSEDESWALSTADNGNGIANFRIGSESASTYGGTANVLCDTLPPDSKTQAEATRAGVLVADGTLCIRLYNTVADTVEGLKTWLAANPTTVMWKLKPPWQTADLAPVDPPTVPASDATLWAASDVPCDIEATTWTASGAEQGRQQAAMVKVAQQVRQQAETVAALAAQALEA